MNLFYSFFKKVFKKELQKDILDSQYKKLNEYKDEQIKIKKDIAIFEYETLLNKPVIVISNEWQNPIIGIATKIEFVSQTNNPMLVVFDYVENKEVMSNGIIYAYNEQRFNGLMKLDPFETCALVYQNLNSTIFSPFDKYKSGVRDSKDVILKKLTQHGFFEKIERCVIEG